MPFEPKLIYVERVELTDTVDTDERCRFYSSTTHFKPGTTFDVYQLVDSGRVFEERKIIVKLDSQENRS